MRALVPCEITSPFVSSLLVPVGICTKWEVSADPASCQPGVDEGRSSVCTLCTWCYFALLPGEGLFISCCEPRPRTDEDFVARNNHHITKALLHARGRAPSRSGSLRVFYTSCLRVPHAPEDQLCFCWLGRDRNQGILLCVCVGGLLLAWA